MAADINLITECDEPEPSDTELMAAAIHCIHHEVRAIARDVAELRAAWRQYEPTIAAYQRGGILAARTARKRNGGGTDG